VASETWTGSDGAAWPAGWTDGFSPVGGGSTIQGNTGRQTTGSATGYSFDSRIARRRTSTAADVVQLVKFRFPAADEVFARVWCRADAEMRGDDGYYLVLDLPNDEWSVFVASGFSDTLLGSAVSQTFTTATWYWADFGAVGSTVRARVWQDGSAVPAWQVDVTDSTHASGSYGLGAFPGNAGGEVVEWDDWSDRAAFDTAVSSPWPRRRALSGLIPR
jgi:hypothetical protein